MQLIKIRFLKNNVSLGRLYTYLAPDDIEEGEMVQLNASAKGIVIEVGVSESEVAGFRDGVKTIIGRAEENKPVIFKNWSVYSVVENKFQAPELGIPFLQGNVYGHPDFPDESFIHTSPIDDIKDFQDYKLVITRTGSRYRVYPDDVLPEAETVYPGYYNRFKMQTP